MFFISRSTTTRRKAEASRQLGHRNNRQLLTREAPSAPQKEEEGIARQEQEICEQELRQEEEAQEVREDVEQQEEEGRSEEGEGGEEGSGGGEVQREDVEGGAGGGGGRDGRPGRHEPQAGEAAEHRRGRGEADAQVPGGAAGSDAAGELVQLRQLRGHGGSARVQLRGAGQDAEEVAQERVSDGLLPRHKQEEAA